MLEVMYVFSDIKLVGQTQNQFLTWVCSLILMVTVCGYVFLIDVYLIDEDTLMNELLTMHR